MTKKAIIIALFAGSFALNGQNINVTFTGTGTVTTIDSIKATNLKTNQSITFPGNETLVLAVNTGVPTVSELTHRGIVFPDPFPGKATFNMVVQKPQNVYLEVRNLVGQVVAHAKTFIEPGENEFALSVNTDGIYLVTIISDQGTSSYKIICSGSTNAGNSIQYLGARPNNLNSQNNYNNQNSLPSSALKGLNSSYTIGYTYGDIILYRCMSGMYTSVLTDSPDSSKNYIVIFAGCKDPDGKNYSIVSIGSQTWMAENLAWLPAVSPSSSESETYPYYYVYGYQGNNVSTAKATTNFAAYGVLYNWVAVKTACPSGWKLPTDAEWTTLTDYLTNNGYGYGGSGSDIGKSIASPFGWTTYSTAGTVGNDQGSNNRSGFSALPCGLRHNNGDFFGLGFSTGFWSSSADGSYAWYRVLYSNDAGVDRLFGGYQRYGFSVRCLKGGYMPTARFTCSPAIGTTLTNFQFDASNSSDPETAVNDIEVRWDWNGDGTWDTGYSKTKTNSCQYPSPGSYIVILEVKDGDGLVDTETKTVFVAEGTFTDPRDSHIYLYHTIGTQTWMAENLAWLPSVSPSSIGSDTSQYYYVYDYDGINVSAAKATIDYANYGVLYNWPASLTVCPSGWHLPTDAEWTVLTEYLTNNGFGNGSSGSDIGKSMASPSGWTPNSSAGTIGNDQGSNNRSGFTALPGGNRHENVGFLGLGDYAYFWSSSEDLSNAWGRSLYFFDDVVYRAGEGRKLGFSVRCLKN